jgi:hypothetical protein
VLQPLTPLPFAALAAPRHVNVRRSHCSAPRPPSLRERHGTRSSGQGDEAPVPSAAKGECGGPGPSRHSELHPPPSPPLTQPKPAALLLQTPTAADKSFSKRKLGFTKKAHDLGLLGAEVSLTEPAGAATRLTCDRSAVRSVHPTGQAGGGPSTPQTLMAPSICMCAGLLRGGQKGQDLHVLLLR